MKQGYRVKLVCIGEGETEDDALEALIYDLHDSAHNIEFGSGEDCLAFEECEIEE